MPLGDVTAAGTISLASGSSSSPAAGSHVDIASASLGTVALQLTGTWTGTVVMEGIEAAGDPTAWVAAPTTTLAGVPITNITANGIYLVNAAPFLIVRVRSTAWTSGTATVTLHGAIATTGGGGGGGGGGAVTIADGSDAAEGATTDAAVQGDNPGTLSAKLRGINITTGLQPTAADFDTKIGSLTETAPATDTASSGLNGRLQRVAQRITSLIALLPAALINGALAMTGDTAHGAADAGNPVEVGFGAVAHGANPAAVTAGQRTRGYANRAGIPFHIGGHPNVINTTQNFTAAQTNAVLVANSAGTKIVVTSFMVTSSNATTTSPAVGIGLAQTVTPPSGTTNRFGSHPGVAPGSGFGRGNGAGIIAVGADGDQVLLTSTAATNGSIDISVEYYTVPS